MSVVGIDLGTTNTVVACVRSGKLQVLADEDGQRLLPSVVAFPPNGEVLVGALAKARRTVDAKNTIHSHKRLIGRSWGSPEILQAKSRFAFELKEGPGHSPLIRARGQDYTLPEISAFVLKRARQVAETALGAPVERAVITVPAHFNELQRASTKVAGRVSGLEVLRILNEPTAAALAYGLGRTGHERVAVYDFGGGTFDCTLLDLNGSVFEVLATAGDPFLGGDDLDDLIAERMAETCAKAHGYDPRADVQQLQRLKASAEEVKVALSASDTHTVVLEAFGGAQRNFTFTMTRADLDAMAMPLVDRCFKVTQDALALAGLTPTSLDKVILVGGSTRMPLVRQRVKSFFGRAPLDRVNPDEVVAIGAAIQAAALTLGTRKRSIPPPPNVLRKPSLPPGESTQTGRTEPFGSAPSRPPPAGGTNPSLPFHPASRPPPAGGTNPSFPFHPASRPPPGGTNPSFNLRPTSRPPPAGGTNPAFPFPAVNPLPGRTPTIPPSAATHRGVAPEAPGGASGAGFGTIEEPPSLVTTASTRPSLPAARGRQEGSDRPSTPPLAAEPEAFGVLSDLSLATTSVSPSLAALASAVSTEQTRGAEPSFGRLSELSLESAAPSAGAAADDLRRKLFEEFTADPGAPLPGEPTFRAAGPGDETDLPSVAHLSDLPSLARPSDLPSVAPGRAQGDRRSRPAPTPRRAPEDGAAAALSAMIGGPPPSTAPLPFGAMESRGDVHPPPVSSSGAAPAPTPSGTTLPSPASSTFGHTVPLNRPVNLGIAPPYPTLPPPTASETAPFGSLGSASPAPPFGSAPPPFWSAPPPFGSAPPPHAGAPPHAQTGGFVAPVLVDVTPRGLVVETAGGYSDAIIPRNAKIPCERTRRFATGRDVQTTVRIRVAQGEHNIFAHNTFLGEVELSGLRPAPRGEVLIAVTFEVDADSTLRVRARDVQTGQEARATLQLIGVADESSVVMMINRLAHQPAPPPRTH